MSVLSGAAYAACLAVAAGGLLFYILVIISTIRRPPRRSPPAGHTPPLTILKPLAGLEEGLEENLRTFFEQDYPEYQILFAVREASDPAAAVVRRLLERYPHCPAELLVAGEPPCPNAKVWSLSAMASRARHSILVVSDSDIRADAGYLQGIAAEFSDPGVGVATCPYRAVPGPSLWSLLEALTVNTEFWSGVLVARLVEGVRFAVGPTMALRREYLEAIGGFAAAGDYLAEDYLLGRWAERHGYRAALGDHVVDHCIGHAGFWTNWKHRVRWARSTRRSRPWGYLGQIFTNPLPFALALAATPAAPLGALVAAGRAAVVAAVSFRLLRDPLTRRYWWLIPLADLASLVVWALGLFGDSVEWRGRRYRLSRDGRLVPARP